MATDDVVAVFNTIASIGSAISDLIDTGYMVSEKSEDLKQKLKQLGREQAFWKAQIVQFDLRWDRDLLKVFLEAKSQLEHEKEGFAREVNSRGLAKLKRAFLPSPVEQTMMRVDKIFENVLRELKRRTDTTGESHMRVHSRVPLLSFKKGDRYVRLDRTNKEVIGALGDADGPPVVLLHGSSGTGKSSLARDVALQVQEAINRRHSAHAGLSQANGPVRTSSLSTVTHSFMELWPAESLMFEQVIFLECGLRVDLQTKQRELRDELGWNPAFPEGGEPEYESDKTLMTVLAGLLKEKSLLIILDDIWKFSFDTPGSQVRNSHFLSKMTDLGGENVKWLVTSQEGGLCSVLKKGKCKSVLMEQIQPEVARRILALQIGVPVEEIRGAAKVYMDKIIQMIDANPLAITCISPLMDPTRFDDEREWEVAMEELANSLGTKAAMQTQRNGYRGSYWEAIKVGFDLLAKQHQNLLILMALCKGPSVPEEIIEYLFVQSKDTHSYQNFPSARRDLERRQLIKISVFKDRMGKEGRRWTLHDMIKEFIMKEFVFSNDGKSSLIQRLSSKGISFKFDPTLESQVVSTLIALYFQEKFRNEFQQFNWLEINNPAVTKRGAVIEPISRLLVLRENDKWTSTLHLSTRQIFVTYVKDGQFDEESTLNLLDSSDYALRMIAALDNFAWSEEYSFIGENVICALVRLLESASILDVSAEQRLDYDLLTGVSGALSRLIRFGEYEDTSSGEFLEGVSFAKAFAQLANLLNKTNENHSWTKKKVVQTLRSFVFSHRTVELELTYTPGLLEGLVRACFKGDNHDLQATAVVIFATLACRNHSVQLRLLDVPGMVDGLVKAMTVNDHHRLQSEASGLLCHLSLSDDTALKIVECPGTLDGLVNGVSKGTNKLHQEHCAQALGHLASCGGNVKLRLLQFPKVIEGLVKASFKDGSRDFQATAVDVLDSLAHQIDSFRLQMVDVPGMLDGLVRALAVDDHHRLQRTASGLLLHLSLDDQTALKIVECPGALLELVNGVGKDTNKLHQICCASTLGRLASLSDSTRLRLIQAPRLSQELVGALMNDDCSLRLAAGLAVAQLAIGNDHVKSEMRKSPGLLEKLIDAVKRDDNCGWAIYVLTVLSPQRGKEIHLTSIDAYSRRGEAEAHLGLYKEALEDLNEARRLGGSSYNTFSTRCYVKARLSDFQEALVDADCAVEKDTSCPWALLERAVVKRLSGDLPGALEDLDKSWELRCNDDPRAKYAILKHRGFTKYLKGDEEGARADGESAMTYRPLTADGPKYGTDTMGEGWSVEYLNFHLR